MTERLHFHFSLSRIGEGNGNPLQCSYLENPRDGGAWWAAIYGVTQSRTQLKQLSSSSSKHTHTHIYLGFSHPDYSLFLHHHRIISGIKDFCLEYSSFLPTTHALLG